MTCLGFKNNFSAVSRGKLNGPRKIPSIDGWQTSRSYPFNHSAPRFSRNQEQFHHLPRISAPRNPNQSVKIHHFQRKTETERNRSACAALIILRRANKGQAIVRRLPSKFVVILLDFPNLIVSLRPDFRFFGRFFSILFPTTPEQQYLRQPAVDRLFYPAVLIRR